MTDERFICIHGHFYQPPRENPWLEAVERQDSAYPYHDWNERITAECYAPNGASRILDGEGRIVQIVNNYARISFNIGPTLLAWLETGAPETYAAILEADRQSQARYGGHGSAIAQVYNHVIMPLATRRDKVTQVVWGLRDFQQRFGRPPEGMWLAETAVDLETLDILADHGVRFTILSPYQAGRVRPLAGGDWQDVGDGSIDPTTAYRQRLPSGRAIDLFFYDGPISRAVAFEGLLERGERLAERLLGGFNGARPWAQLVHIATDGESYGHHHRHGDMALAYALHHIEQGGQARLTVYGEHLERFPPTHEVEIVEQTAWSCAHGVGRWQDDCGCNSGGYPGWNQAWRGPLRAALDWLRDTVAPLYERQAGALVADPWAARDGYIEVILDRAPANVDRFIARHARRPLAPEERVRLLKLLELQRHALLMYTSCGWFFDELSGIETVQVIQYAGRVVQLAEELGGQGVEAGFVARLTAAHSNLPEHGDGARIYQKWVKPAVVDPAKVAAHYAITALFQDYPPVAPIYCYTVEREEELRRAAGPASLALGRLRLTDRVTSQTGRFRYGAVYAGGHTMAGSVRPIAEPPADEEPADEEPAVADAIVAAFERADTLEVVRLFERHLGETTSLRALFRDEQRLILDYALAEILSTDEAAFRLVYERRAPMMRFLADLGTPRPRSFQAAAEVIVNLDLRRLLEADPIDQAAVGDLLAQAALWSVPLDAAGLAYAAGRTLDRLARAFRRQPGEPERLRALAAAAEQAAILPFEVDRWQAQNDYYAVLHAVYPARRARAAVGDAPAAAWVEQFRALGHTLGVKVTDDYTADHGPRPADLAAELLAGRRLPRATYRLQFNRDFTFADAAAVTPFLEALGISDAYASPLFAASPDSSHGYDVNDYSRLNPALGGDAGFARLAATLHEHGLGVLLDMVPNHMGIAGSHNAWWQDVLENGPSSIYADFFDINWQPAARDLENRVLLPILEDQYGVVLESGKLQVVYDGGAFFVQYYETRLPIAPRSYRTILRQQLPALIERLGREHEHVLELQSILTAIKYLPSRTRTDPGTIAESHREKEIVKRRIAALAEESPAVRAAIEAALAAINGDPANPDSFNQLDELLNAQAYRLSYWRVATDEINYRRFFDINDLAAIRVELPPVFNAVHQHVFDLLAAGRINGLRIDHPDGLWNPAAYFQRLQRRYVERWLTERGHAPELAPAILDELAAGERPAWPLYVVAEKILAYQEPLPSNWAIAGATGYDFLTEINALFIDSRHEKQFDRIYSQLAGSEPRYGDLVNATKKMVMLVTLASEVNALSQRLDAISNKNRRYRDFTLNSLTFAIREVIAGLNVYRTYITSPEDAAALFNETHIHAAVAEARRRNPRTAANIFDFIEETLLLRNLDAFRPDDRAEAIDFVMRFQQITAPVMAKGVEDTAFYRYNRLVALNEVGGHPDRFGLSPAHLHARNQERRRRWPQTLLATATHDTKRGEDTRARLAVLSELPDEWRAAVGRWSRLNGGKKGTLADRPTPDRNAEYLLYQTLLGVWPEPWDDPAARLSPEELAEFRERIGAYMLKAAREAKVHTSWFNTNAAYEAALERFVGRLLERPNSRFLDDLRALHRRVAYFGHLNSLAQTLIKLTAPGVPDLYQGTELWALTLVDPDNRRPVDFERRRALLASLRPDEELTPAARQALAAELVARASDGRIKLYVIQRALAERRAHPDLFAAGDYLPLEAIGARASHVFAFARRQGEAAVVTVVPRLVVGLTGGQTQPPTGPEVWGDTRLPLPAEWQGRCLRNLYTGERLSIPAGEGDGSLPLADLLRAFPVALLALEAPPEA